MPVTRLARTLYGSAIFLGAFLLFAVEPMAAKRLLPALGGSSAVWITCLVFFQTVLLLGYLYAHALTYRVQVTHPSRPAFGRKVSLHLLHIALLVAAGCMLLLVPEPDLRTASAHPFTAIFDALGISIGLPFLLLASTSPLLQVWLARETSGTIPWRLFALSNAGSLLALLLYPFLIEPRFTLTTQRQVWIAAFVLYAVLCSVIALRPRTTVAIPIADSTPSVPLSPLRTRLLWFFLPAAAAIQLSAVTEHISQNIAAIPLLWIVPLTLYLLTFIIAFETPRLYRPRLVLILLLVVLLFLAWVVERSFEFIPVLPTITLFLGELFLACYFCHAETHALRPANGSEATVFYLCIAAGGSAGALFVGIVCPLLFNANYDMALALIALAAVGLWSSWPSGWPYRTGWGAMAAALLSVPFLIQYANRHSLFVERNFYGPLRVTESPVPAGNLTARALQGVSEYGKEWFGPQHRRAPIDFYTPDSGLGLAVRFCCGDRPANIGMVGMGAACVAAYGRPGDRITFYEINPAIIDIAHTFFTYIADSGAAISAVPGDGRLSLEAQPPQHFDVLAVDAFLGDAIPVHLLTTGAMKIYLRHLTPGGILVFNISNPYLNLAPEIAALAQSAGMESRRIVVSSNFETEQYGTIWMLVTANRQFLDRPELAANLPDAKPRLMKAWTDDDSSLFPVLNWRGIHPW